MAGILLKYNYSIKKYNQPKIAAFKEKRDVMMHELNKHINNFPLPISYNIPQGGFFLELIVPFSISKEQLNCAINKYNIIFCPMWFFYNTQTHTTKNNSIRLSFSKPTQENIIKGISYMFDFFYNQILESAN